MLRQSSQPLLALAVALTAWCFTVQAQNSSDVCNSAVNPPGDVTVQLSVKDGQTVFREGEIISLVLEYSSDTEKKYSASTRGYDRSGRLSGVEEFCISPDAGSDPLFAYFNDPVMGFIGGGLSSDLALSSSPYSVYLELNEWRSLPPGSYRLGIVSRRVSVQNEDAVHLSDTSTLLRSNDVEFQVVKADPEWQSAQLAVAISTLDSSTGDDAKHAARVLRFLGSEASTQELAKRFWSGNDQPFGWDLKFGLVGSPYRTAAIEAMSVALRAPQHPVTMEVLQTLTTLEMQSDPKYKLPQYDEKNQEAWTRARDAYSSEYNKRMADHTSAAVAALPSKTGRALGVTASELLQSDAELNTAAKAQLRLALLTSWDSLPVNRQNELIEYRWEQVGGPEWLPILEGIVNGEPNPNHQMDKLDRGPAVRRLYEIAPAEGRRLILREIANPKGDVGINVLGLLPERELPQIEQPLIGKLHSGIGGDVEFQLLERYASSRVLPEVKAIYEVHRGEWACVPQTAMLRYFLRVSPEYGVAQVSDSLGQRSVTGCYKYQLTGLNEEIRQPKLERIAIASLEDVSPEVVRDAAEALQKYGSVKAEAALWKRLEKFHEHWKDQAEELRYRPGANVNTLAEVGLAQTLVQAIANGQAWFVDEGAIHRLKQLASPQMQPELDSILQEIKRDDYRLSLNWWPEGILNYNLGRYTGQGMMGLKQKLAQFPPGTHFSLVLTAAEQDRHRAEFTEVEAAAAANGLALQVQISR